MLFVESKFAGERKETIIDYDYDGRFTVFVMARCQGGTDVDFKEIGNQRQRYYGLQHSSFARHTKVPL